MRTPAVANPPADATPRVRRLRTLSRPWAAALLGAGILALVLAIPLVVAGGLGLLLSGRIMPGVTVAGVDLGFLTTAEAEARMRSALPDLATGELAITLDGVTSTVSYDELGRDHDYAALVAAALAVGRSGDPWADGQARLSALVAGHELTDAVHLDTAAFDGLVVDTAARAFVRAQDAGVVINPDGTYAVTPPVTGSILHPQVIRDALATVLMAPEPGDTAVTLSSEPVPYRVSQVQAAEAAAAARAMLATPLAITDGANAYPIAPAAIQPAIRFGMEDGTDDGEYGVILSRALLADVLAGVAEAVHRDPVNAGFVFGANGPTSVRAAVPGRDLNVDQTVDAVMAALQQRGTGRDVPSAAIAVSFVDADLSTADAQAVLPNLVRISTWTTYYQVGAGNGFGANISIPARDLDGFVILPGATFDFWRDIGPVTAERGYTYGGAIIDGRSVAGKALAGGICSTSTTLFNTALRAGLEMGARLNHYYYIPRYPMGLDATVYATDYWTQTMSFTNDTEGPLIIRSYTGPGMVRFDLWGLPLNRTVTFSNPIVTNRRTAGDVIEYTSSLPAGTSKRVEYPHNGFDVTVTRTVRDKATGEVIWTNTYFSAYKAVDGVTLVGTG